MAAPDSDMPSKGSAPGPKPGSLAHGPQFDDFPMRGTSPHGPQFDEGFGLMRAHADAHGKLFDMFDSKPTSQDSKHGPQWDEFAWKMMPDPHGVRYDENFAKPTAETSGHGVWFDTFKNGNGVRYIYGGKDYEGSVVDYSGGDITVESREGLTHIIGPEQVRLWASATDSSAPERKAATKPRRNEVNDAARGAELVPIGNTLPVGPSTAEAPSAHSATASGGPHLRKGIDALLDVQKSWLGDAPEGAPTHVECPKCGKPAKVGMHDAANCGHCFHSFKASTAKPVMKSMDSTETAVQGDTAKTVGHRRSCPKGGDAPCGADEGGKCAVCGAAVRDHEAVGKVFSDGLNALKALEVA